MYTLLYLFFLISNIYGGLISPPDESFLNRIHILFEWEQMPEANNYQFQLSENSEFEDLIIDLNNTSLVYIDIENLDWETSYFWRIRPLNNLDPIGPWTSVSTFTTGTAISEVETNIYNGEQINSDLIIFGAFFNYFSAVVDNSGKEIWNSGSDNIIYYSTSKYGDIFGCYLLSGAENNLPGIEFSFDIGTIWDEPNDDFLHHDLIQIPNGNYLGIIEESSLGVIPIGDWTSSFQNLGFQADGSTVEFPWVGDQLVEWNKDTKEIVWSWSVFDHFNMNDYDEYGGTWNQAYIDLHYDWTHVNAVIFDEDESAIYISTRHLSRITKIDYPSGDVIWNIGHEMISGDIDMGMDLGFSFQHSLQKLDNGNILTLDNGNLSPQFRGTDEPITRAIEISIDDNIATMAWSYELPQDLFGFASGNAQKLENNNILITTVGGSGRSLEVTEQGEVVWEAQYNLGLPNGAVYRANRISGLYPASFSLTINNYMEYDGDIGVYTPPGNSTISFTLNHEGSKSQKFFYAIQDQENWFSNQEGNVFLDPGESYNISFEGSISTISGANPVILTIYPEYHPEKEKIFYVDTFTSPLTDVDKVNANKFKLYKPYPNPFNSQVTFEFLLSFSDYFSLQIYNVKGELIENLIQKELQSGNHKVLWNAIGKPSGIYFAKISSYKNSQTEKIIYLK
tara:strand:+ start:1088 stop:3124 length:2037 start_codon:yes stop_codon:yes gene_type:complete